MLTYTLKCVNPLKYTERNGNQKEQIFRCNKNQTNISTYNIGLVCHLNYKLFIKKIFFINNSIFIN